MRSLRWARVPRVLVTDLYFLKGPDRVFQPDLLARAASSLFADPVTQRAQIDDLEVLAASHGPPGCRHRATVLKRAGVMDPVEASTVRGLADLGMAGVAVH